MEHHALTEQRIEHVADLMRRFKYVRGKTSKALALKWGLALKTVETYTADASKRVRAELADPDRVRVDVTLTLEAIMRRARAARLRPVFGKNGIVGHTTDWEAARVAVLAAATWAKVTGNDAPTKLDVTLTAPEFKSAKEALEHITALIPELEQRAAAEAAGLPTGNA